MKQEALIGFTGFVGHHLWQQHSFSHGYHSGNIETIRGRVFDLLVCCGIRAEKWLANQQPEKDWAQIQALLDQLKTVKAEKVVLISTVDVYPQPWRVDEATYPDPEAGHAYGRHRLWAEKKLAQYFQDLTIVRLPALFGQGLKKNFIFDLLHPQPRFLPQDKVKHLLQGLSASDKDLVLACYQLDGNGNYALQPHRGTKDLAALTSLLESAGLTSLGFTHQASTFQFYDLKRLWHDIEIGLAQGLKLLNLVTEPVSAREVARLFGYQNFHNETSSGPVHYDVRSLHADCFQGQNGYLYAAKTVGDDLVRFFQEAKA